MAPASLLAVLGIAFCAGAPPPPPPPGNKGLCLLQQGKLRSVAPPLAEEEEEHPADSPDLVDQPPAQSGEDETIEEKEKELAKLAKVEGATEEATKVLGELANGKAVKEEELPKLEIAVSKDQSQETLEENGALLTSDDFAKMDGKRVEEEGGGDDGPFFEGDILPSGPDQLALLQELKKAWLNGTSRSLGGAGKPWTDGRIPYCFAPDVSQNVRDVFRAAVASIHSDLQCLTFDEIACTQGTSTSTERWQDNFDPKDEAKCEESPAVFVKSNPSQGCYSALGMVESWPSQSLQLQDPGCAHMGITIHEIGHALGFHHEHQRTDRDSYIVIHWDNIQPQAKAWFNTAEDVDTSQEYDFLSIMHYASNAFAQDRDKPTITSKSGAHAGSLGARGSLAESDTMQLEALYKLVKDTCKVNTRTGMGCKDSAEGICKDITECSEEARTNCCACGSGRQVQCYEDQPCTPHELLSGPSAPYHGWVGSHGTIGGWWYGSVEEGLEKCKDETGCVGITLPVSAENARTGKHWVMFKEHFLMGGGASSGWTSFRLAPPATTPEPTTTTPAPTPAPTPKPTPKKKSNNRRWKKNNRNRNRRKR